MERKIIDILSDYEDNSISIETTQLVSPDKIKEICMEKIYSEKTSGKKSTRRVLTLIFAAALIVALSVTAFAGFSRRILGWGGNAEIISSRTDRGVMVSASMDTDNVSFPAELRGDRLILVVNGENLDITDDVTPEHAYIYTYSDEDDILHHIIIGSAEAFAEFIEDPDGDWIGGYGSGYNHDEPPQWLIDAKRELNIPWN